VLPVGLGLQLGDPQHTAFIGVAAGIGASGAPNALSSAGTFPIQVASVFRLSEKLNLMSRVRAVWLINDTPRDDGARSASFCDELDGMLAIQRSRHMNYLDGYYVGLAYRELNGARFVGAVIGIGVGEEIFDEDRR